MEEGGRSQEEDRETGRTLASCNLSPVIRLHLLLPSLKDGLHKGF
jgi:hypothetical protein